MIKIAVTLPEEQMRAVERIRRQERIPRSRVIQRAVSFYLAQAGIGEDVRAYEEGYRRKPERSDAAEAYTRAAAEVLSTEDWT
jgi:metal-responsive CopG/Arc/MetJ family transcriptional regulator